MLTGDYTTTVKKPTDEHSPFIHVL